MSSRHPLLRYLPIFLAAATVATLSLVSPAASAMKFKGGAPTNSAPPTISGTTVQGSTLTASAGSWSGPQLTFTYTWERCSSPSSCTAIGGATASTYTLTTADVGNSIDVDVTASNSRGTASATSSLAGPVAPLPSGGGGGGGGGTISPPAASTPPAITGTAMQGSTLSASTGAWTGSPTSYAYQWIRCTTSTSCTPFTNTNGNTYTLTSVDVGATMKVAVTATNAGGSATSTSSPTGTVAPPPVSSISVSVTSPTAGATVSGRTPFDATVSGATPTWVAMTVDGGAMWSEVSAPYQYNGETDGKFDTTTVSNGTHTFAATAHFADGTSAVSSVTANVQNTTTPPPPPPPSPTVSVTAPASGATVSGSIPFAASVANGTASKVELTVDGGSLYTDSAAPYSYNGDSGTLDTTKLPNGNHTFNAKAYLSDGTTVTGSTTANVQNTVSPPPSTTVAHDGTGVIRFGNSWTQGTGYDRYDYVMVGYGDVDKAAALTSAKALIYKGAVDVYDSPNTDPGLNNGGVPYSQANANGWILKDTAGNVMHASGFGNYFGDIGAPGFQQAWATNVINFLTAHHADGVFIDNVLCSITGLSGGAVPAKYTSDAAFANAYISFLSYIGPALQSKGFYVSANTYCSGPSDMSANNAWWTRVAPYINGLMNEVFEQSPLDYTVRYFDSPTTSWMGNWKANLNVLQAAQAAGKDAFALTYGAGSNTSLMTYARASYMLVWNGKGGSFMWNPTDSADPYNSAWTADIGTPNASMVQVGGVYTRDYSKGYVVVNPSLSSATVSVPSGLKTLAGAAVGTSLTIPSQTAVIYAK
jgi:hypothetical protein